MELVASSYSTIKDSFFIPVTDYIKVTLSQKYTKHCIAGGLLIYIIYCKTQRYKYYRLHQQIEQQAKETNKAISRNQYAIIRSNILYHDMPFFTILGSSLAIYKTFGIPSISSLLAKNKQFKLENITRRLDDTGYILGEFFINPPCSPRSDLSIKRLNAIHGHYKISNDDFLYTLVLFCVEPLRFVELYGYRQLLEIEKDAIYEQTKQLGIAMNLKHIPINYQQMIDFAENYEAKKMKYTESNAEIANISLQHMANSQSFMLRAIIPPLYKTMIQDILLDAFEWKKPAKIWYYTRDFMVMVHKFIIRNLMLPRSKSISRLAIEMDPVTERYIPTSHAYKDTPYKKGYKIEELGPVRYEKDGKLGKLGVLNKDSLKDYSDGF